MMAGAAGIAGAQDQPTQKINKKNLVIKEWNTDVKTNAQILDHTTTYNSEGRKIEEIEYSPNGVKWRKRFEYNAAGKVTKELFMTTTTACRPIKHTNTTSSGARKHNAPTTPKASCW